MLAEPPTPLSFLLADAVRRLRAAGVPSAEHDAQALLSFAADRTAAELLSAGAVDPAVASRFLDLVARRAAREPLQHIVGSVGFRYIELDVGPGVFVPRPETEVVVGAAIVAARRVERPVVVDLCSGSGAIPLAIAHEVPAATVHAVEVEPAAVEWLRRNAELRAAAGDSPIAVHAADAAVALPELDGAVDVVVSNPPYVAAHELHLVDPEVRDHDPQPALVAHDDGLGLIRVVATTAMRLLKPGGTVIVEHSDRQGTSAPAVLRECGFADVADHTDLAGRDRFCTGIRP